MKIKVIKRVFPVRRMIVSFFVLMLLGITLVSCASKKCDAYKSSHRYHREIIR